MLRARRCDLAQAFYLGAPEPIESVGLQIIDFSGPLLTAVRPLAN